MDYNSKNKNIFQIFYIVEPHLFKTKKKLLLICKENIKIQSLNRFNQKYEDIIIKYQQIKSVQLNEENDKQLLIIYNQSDQVINYYLESSQRVQIVSEIYKIIDIIKNSTQNSTLFKFEAGILLDCNDLSNYEFSNVIVQSTSILIEYYDLKINQSNYLQKLHDSDQSQKNIRELVSFVNIQNIKKTPFGFSIISNKSNKIINLVIIDLH